MASGTGTDSVQRDLARVTNLDDDKIVAARLRNRKHDFDRQSRLNECFDDALFVVGGASFFAFDCEWATAAGVTRETAASKRIGCAFGDELRSLGWQ
jgi:hypothetical protein